MVGCSVGSQTNSFWLGRPIPPHPLASFEFPFQHRGHEELPPVGAIVVRLAITRITKRHQIHVADIGFGVIDMVNVKTAHTKTRLTAYVTFGNHPCRAMPIAFA
jgi:hypothetical protein